MAGESYYCKKANWFCLFGEYCPVGPPPSGSLARVAVEENYSKRMFKSIRLTGIDLLPVAVATVCLRG